MSGGGEIVGDIAEGALIARAAEPGHGEGGDGHTDERACLNCGTKLIGSHCHSCGQAAHVHRTLGAFFHDLLHGVFHFEGKIWRTFPLLVWRPGKLTREYIDGRRASYVSPIALFLFCVFLMFAVVKQFGGNLGDLSTVDVNGTKITGLAENEAEIARLKQQRAELVAAGKPTDAIDGQIAGRESGVEAIKRVRGEFSEEDLAAVRSADLSSDLPMLQHAFDKFKANPGLAIYKVQSNAYKYSWALIPISVPFVWLLFPFSRRFHIYDHTVFVTYSLCFMTLLVVVLTLGMAAGLPGMGLLAMLLPPWHMFRQLREAYQLRRRSALWRTVLLVFFANTAIGLFAMLVLTQAGA